MRIFAHIAVITLLSCSGTIPANVESDSTVVLNEEEFSSNDQITQNFNISILMDLSDRISPSKYPNPTMEYYLRDVEYIRSVVKGFQSNVMNKRVRMINDQLNAFFDPPPKSPSIIGYAEGMKANFNHQNITKESIEQLDEVFTDNALAIYEQAIKDGKYVGSDTWGFFKNHVERYCIREGYRNIIVILTDGYIYHVDQKREEGYRTSYVTPEKIRELKLNDANWRNKMLEQNIGFIPVDADLKGADVLVLGLNPDDKNDYEADVLLQYWADWLDGMNVNKYEILLSDLPSNLDRTIQEFIVKP
jgi:hypothetical protein